MAGKDNKSNSDTDINEAGALENVGDIIGDMATNIPAPIRKNAFKAFAQLCTAAVDIPVAHLEGIAAEKRSVTQARIKIINTGADQIAHQMDVSPEYAHAAVKKYGQKIVREQVNLDDITKIAASELNQKDENEGNTEAPDISLDWLNTFEREACDKSSEDMKLLFGKILAGEIRKPSTYSIKTIKLLSQLDNEAANLFQTLCSLSSTIRVGSDIVDSRVICMEVKAGENGLIDYGLNFSRLIILEEHGLITSEYNSYMKYELCLANESNQSQAQFSHQGKLFNLKKIDETKPTPDLKMHGVMLSRTGTELLGIIDISRTESYTNKLIKFFQNKGIEMNEVII